jgi:glyoxylase-like metal-dependent hydrolase (beta-lactamase superfamily II)
MSPKDIEQIIITHGHLDHFGGANELSQKPDKPPVIAAHREDVPLIEGRASIHDKVKYPFLSLAGYPMKHKIALRILDSRARSNFSSCRVSRQLEDGDAVQCGKYKGEILWTPGHSEGSICVYLRNENILFSGDTVIPHVTPNPIVMLEAGAELPVRKSQAEFYSSIAKLEAINPAVTFPGHGQKIDDIKKVTSLYRRHYDMRHLRILECLKNGEQTVYQIASVVFPVKARSRPQASFEVFLAISEVYTHLQLLEEEGRVEISRRGKILYVKLRQQK